jgi:hypothetical protein
MSGLTQRSQDWLQFSAKHGDPACESALDPRKSTETTLAYGASAGVVAGLCARPSSSQAVCVA